LDEKKKILQEGMTFRGVEVESHREALGTVLERTVREEDVAPARRTVLVVMKWAAPVAVAALLVLSAFLVINIDKKPGSQSTSAPVQQKYAAEAPDPTVSTMLSINAPTAPNEPAATFKNLEDAEKVVQMKIMRPAQTYGGAVTQAVIGTYTNQEPVIFIKYDNGLQITAYASREPVNYAGWIEGLKWNESQMNSHGSSSAAPTYQLLDVRGHQGFTWGKDVHFWEDSIAYELSSADGSIGLTELLKIADSMTGKTAVPPPGAKVPLPPNYPDIESARRMSRIDFRAPKDTGGAQVTAVYATTVSTYGTGTAGKDLKADGKLVTISYSNDMHVGYESPVQTDDRDWVVVRKLDIDGHPAEVVEAPGGQPDVDGLVLKWNDGAGRYSVSFSGPQSQLADSSPPHIQDRIAQMQDIARSMYR
jgi:hypothetical protein